MDIAAQELDRARGPFACGVADKADQISALWTGRSDAVPRTRRRGERSGHGFTGGQMHGTFGKQCNRRNHGATGSRVRCRENRSDRCAMRRAGYGAMRERSGHNAAKRQLDGMRNGAERRHLERTLASGIAAQNKKAPA